MTVNRITLTGVDDKTSVEWMQDVCNDLRIITMLSGKELSAEFGILRSPKDEVRRRFPSQETIDNITDYIGPENLSFHLCGEYARMVHERRFDELSSLIDFSKVGRVQVNSKEVDQKGISNLFAFQLFIGRPVIAQWDNDKFISGPVQFLQDRSGGKGIVETRWATPSDETWTPQKRYGYAGGLTPLNIGWSLVEMDKASDGLPYWIDCESGVRTDDWFDQSKAIKMIFSVLNHLDKQ